MSTAKRPVGRPRDNTIDDRVLAATKALLVEQGFDAATIQAIAERSGVHASAIYRRWPSRLQIIEQVVFPGEASVHVEPTGDLRRDLRRFIRSVVSTLGSPVARAGMPHLMAAYQGSPRSKAAPREWMPISVRPQFAAIVAAAPADAIDPTQDIGDVFDALLAAVIGRIIIPSIAGRDRPVERIVDMAIRLLAPFPDGALT